MMMSNTFTDTCGNPAVATGPAVLAPAVAIAEEVFTSIRAGSRRGRGGWARTLRATVSSLPYRGRIVQRVGAVAGAWELALPDYRICGAA